VNAKEVFLSKQDHRNGIVYRQYITADINENTAAFKKYRDIQKVINLQVDYPEASIIHSAVGDDGKKEFLKVYSTDAFGFRKTFLNPKAKKHLIIAGDSNVFGLGSNDDETMSARLRTALPAYQIINMGIAGSAGNSLLYFLNHYQLKEMIPAGKDEGMMFYDFSDYLVERMIGGKNFIRWGWMQPAYLINDKNELYYAGPFNNFWITKFYKLVGLIDPKNFFFPNLPRIGEDHFKLVARIFLEIKSQYLAQTNAHNRFAILINPFFMNEGNRERTEKQIAEFHRLGIETIIFNGREGHTIEIYPRDLHFTPKGLEYYSSMIAARVK
jgi:hypothetical protein